MIKAAEWYWKAGQRGASPSRPFLSESLDPLPTSGVEDRQFVEFYSLYAKAQARREPEAMRKLGREYLEGDYGRADPVQAYAWLSYAARKGDAEAGPLAQQARTGLNAAELAEAERETKELQEEERRRERARELLRQEAARRAAEREREAQ